MTHLLRRLSFRWRILLLVLAIGLVPLGVLGLWLTAGTARSGETLLRERLREALEDSRAGIEREWVPYRSGLLDLTDLPGVKAALAAGPLPERAVPALAEAFGRADLSLERVELRGVHGGSWTLERSARAPAAFGVPLLVTLPVYDGFTGDSLGELSASVHLSAFRARATSPMAGAVVTATDPRTGAVLLPIDLDPALLAAPRFSWNDEPWVAERVDGTEPPLRLMAAAPLAPFSNPFERGARRGLLAVSLVLLAGLAFATLLSRRLTGSLQELADAAGAVTAGDLSRRVESRSADEVGQVAAAFNTMTAKLRSTLDQLAERESLAAVNEFAAALAHEVRNPLTAIQLDLQEVEEGLGDDSPLRPLQRQALDDLRRLDRTVGGALDAARSGRVQPRPMDLADAVGAAARAAKPAFDRAGATLVAGTASPVPIQGDPDALQRVVLNLLLNAADAVTPGGRAEVEIREDGEHVAILVRDDGPGVDPATAARIFDAFYTTRPGGTGMGLAVARRIVAAHRGRLELKDPGVGRGATFEITLPRL